MTEKKRKIIKSFIKKQKRLYKKLKPCYCPALGDVVYFTSDGWNHLIYCRRRPRNLLEQRYRAGLVKYLNRVISNSTKATKDIKHTKSSLIITWSLQYKIGKQLIKVIVIKKGASKISFLSVMSRK